MVLTPWATVTGSLWLGDIYFLSCSSPSRGYIPIRHHPLWSVRLLCPGLSSFDPTWRLLSAEVPSARAHPSASEATQAPTSSLRSRPRSLPRALTLLLRSPRARSLRPMKSIDASSHVAPLIVPRSLPPSRLWGRLIRQIKVAMPPPTAPSLLPSLGKVNNHDKHKRRTKTACKRDEPVPSFLRVGDNLLFISWNILYRGWLCPQWCLNQTPLKRDRPIPTHLIPRTKHTLNPLECHRIYI